MQVAEKIRSPELVRELNVWHAIAIVVGTIIGSGILLVSKEMTQDIGSAGVVYLAWIVGGLLSFFGALTYAELGALRPWAGGEYVYVRDAYGPLMGFLYGWTWFVIAKPGSIATITSGLVRVLGEFSAFSFLPHNLLVWHITQQRTFTVTWGHLVAILAAILITALNYVGVRKAGNFQLVFTALKVVMIAGVAILGLRWLERPQHGERGDPQPRTVDTSGSDRRSGNRGCALHWNERGDSVRPAGDSDCRLRRSWCGRFAPGNWQLGRSFCHSGHGNLDAGNTQWNHHERRPHTFCRRSRWLFLSCPGG